MGSHSNYYGGNPQVFGGVSDLYQYASSVSTANKRKLISNIAADMKRALNIKKLDPNASTESIIKTLQSLVKELKGKTIINSSQKKVCDTLAHSINERYGRTIINLDDDPHIVCKKVSEIVNTLSSTLNTEFMAIAGDVKKSINNLNLLKEHLKAAHLSLLEKINKSDDEMLIADAVQVTTYYNNINGEMDRQLAILANIVSGVVTPVEGNLISLLEENSDFESFVEGIKNDLGSDEFGQKLSNLLAGVNNVAAVASVVDKALKKIGMSIADYKNTHGVKQLREKIYQLMIKKGDKLGSRDIGLFMEAAEMLYKNDYAHEDIVQYLEKKRGGYRGGTNQDPVESVGGAYAFGGYGATEVYPGGEEAEAEGGAYTTLFPTRKSRTLEHRMKKQVTYRKAMFNDFKKRLDVEYNHIVNVVHKIAPLLGTEIPINDDLLDFTRAFHELEQADRKDFHIVLTGYRKDASARDEKNKFNATAKTVVIRAQKLASGPKGQMFAAIVTAVNNVITIVDTFTDKFLRAVRAVAIDTPSVAERKLVKVLGQDEHVEGGAKLKERLAAAVKKVKVDVQQRVVEQGEAVLDSVLPPQSPVVASNEDIMISGRQDNVDNVGGFPSIESDMEAAYDQAGMDEPTDLNFDEPAALPDAVELTYGHGEVSGGYGYDTEFSTITQAYRDLRYYIHIAQIKENLKTVPSELKDFDENYVSLLGDAAADLIDRNQLEQKKALKFLKPGNPVDTDGRDLYVAFKFFEDILTLPKGTLDGVTPEAKSSLTGTTVSYIDIAKRMIEVRENYKTFLKKKYEAQKDLIEVAQAIDLYMRAFARAVAENPDSLKEIHTILDSVTIVAKWYGEASGDIIAKLYERNCLMVILQGYLPAGIILLNNDWVPHMMNFIAVSHPLPNLK